jgi:hypothetical protein
MERSISILVVNLKIDVGFVHQELTADQLLVRFETK